MSKAFNIRETQKRERNAWETNNEEENGITLVYSCSKAKEKSQKIYAIKISYIFGKR